jgi:DNA-directed RNA polymerase subunit RPC12/RpoP
MGCFWGLTSASNRRWPVLVPQPLQLRAVNRVPCPIVSFFGLRVSGRKETITPMDDTVQIRCTRCKSQFRDRARRVHAGYSRQCPQCEVLIFFEESSADKNVQRALLEARRMRLAVQELSVDDIRQATAAFGPEAPRGADTNRSHYLRHRSY